jgi:hypothetical protein
MFELSLLAVGTMLALSVVFGAVRPTKEGDPFYV